MVFKSESEPSKSPKVAVALVATKDFKGRIIRWASDSKVNHAMLIYEDTLWTGFWSAEALFRKGVVRPPFDYDDSRYLRMELFVYRGNSAIGLQDLRGSIGADYDYKGAIVGTLRMIFRKLFGTLSNVSIHDHKKFFCFELVIQFIRNLKAVGSGRLVPENTSPAMLRKWLVEHEDFQQMSIEQFLGDV